MIQPDPAIVRAILAKHDDNDRPSACETCVVADHLRITEATLADYAAEVRTLRAAMQEILALPTTQRISSGAAMAIARLALDGIG